MIIEGFIVQQYNGGLGMYDRKIYHELSVDDVVEVDTGKEWIKMSVQHAIDGYYLHSKILTFYPKMVYARFDTKRRKEENDET